MFIINLTYKVPLEKVDQYLQEHVAYLNEQYDLGHFVASGRKLPRTGGVILSNMKVKEDLIQVIELDPFKKHDLADFEITEFVPSKAINELSFLIQ
ncbi:YciI family protein [Fulvivirga ligni]|uniref:YciI family protein n=1 Tax=Fulvivirga ligni TaxID=2904246 RepID=UPI001F29308C|nr:YciI family protein [Fulvivirga ligni]UII20493.1 YciI family protein [Fulvivirga ligni]